MRKFLSILVLLAAMALSLSAEEVPLSSGSVLAIVGDKVITSVDVEAKMAGIVFPEELDAVGRAEAAAKARKDILDQMVDFELVYLDFVDKKGKIPTDYFQGRIDKFVVSQANGDEEKFRDMLHANNMTYNDFLDQLRKSVAVEMMTYDRTRRFTIINDNQVRDYFYAHVDDFSTSPSYRMQVIMLRPDGRYADKLQETSGKIMKRYADGADFSALAKEYSEGMNAEDGGDLGWREEFAPAFQKLAESLKPGELYPGLVQIGKSYYLVRLAEKKEGKTPQLDAQTEEAIRNILKDEVAKEKYKQYIKRLRLKFPVQYLAE